MQITTYSFQDLVGAIAHPLVGAYPFSGEGTGSIEIAMDGDVSSQSIAADGSVMVSKMLNHSGRVTISAQQTSPIHKWLLALYNLLYYGPTSQWATGAATLRNVANGNSHLLTGISFQRKPSTPYQAQGQNVTWVFLCADVQDLNA